MQNRVNLLSNFLFVLFDSLESSPEVSAEKTEIAIRNAIGMLYPKELNHVEFREEWVCRYASYLRDSLDELIENTKKDKEKRTRGNENRIKLHNN